MVSPSEFVGQTISHYRIVAKLDGSGYWRTSDHWGDLGKSGYALGWGDGTNVNFSMIGGKLVPGEQNLWLFNRPITGFVRYSNDTLKTFYYRLIADMNQRSILTKEFKPYLIFGNWIA
jgi:hypothetical protein